MPCRRIRRRQLQRYTEDLGQRYDPQPDDKRDRDGLCPRAARKRRYDQAVAVAQRLAAKYPKDMQVLGAYGKALVEAGRLREAANVLPEAHTPDEPNWSILSAQGTVEDQLGDHDQAQGLLSRRAEDRAEPAGSPVQPRPVLRLVEAIASGRSRRCGSLRRSPARTARVRQNLALVLSLEGKFNAAQTVAQQDLAPVDAAEDVASIRQMIAQSDTWNQIRESRQAASGLRLSRIGCTTMPRLEKARRKIARHRSAPDTDRLGGLERDSGCHRQFNIRASPRVAPR